ncbi:MAG: ADP,ATP carrier protein 1 [Chlamydiales bacterium]|nr:ADP,ATP carrier protein 1 [Chlamydiales bacterium]MCH9635527.1 ADP,ATP carrier protein 1 [Chlamydiales bacterium]MCH9703736.1 NTP/NDP exchange transporter [Chlamydiota bacterium]
MSNETTKEFGKWRSFFWPIHAYELKKILPMFLMFFCISFNYTILRDTKDTLIVTAPGSGAEAIPFIKVWLVVPCAIVFMIIYAKLSNILSKQKLFYAVITPFLIFFALFPTVIYPNRELLHPTALADNLQASLPVGMMGMIAIFRNWTFAAFYVLAELWGSVMLSLMFWGFANEITRVSEAKRFYALFGIGANLALLCSGPCIIAVSKIRSHVPEGVDPWGVSLNLLMGMVMIAGVVIMLTYRWINKNVLTDPRFFDPNEQKAKKKSKPKMSLKESFMYLVKSPYIGLLAVLVISYGVAINIVEVTWKSQLKLQYPNANEYSAFMGLFSTITGAVTVFMMLFVGGNVMRRFGWTVAAVVTPIVLLITGGIFFSLILFRTNLDAGTMILGMTPLLMAVVVGMVQNIMSKSCKYSLFDPTKEMAYIPLDQEQKVKGKAAIDVVGARLGKSGGSLLQQGLLVTFGSLAAITPYLAIILFGIIAFWLVSARALGKRFVALTKPAAEEAPVASADEAPAKA